MFKRSFSVSQRASCVLALAWGLAAVTAQADTAAPHDPPPADEEKAPDEVLTVVARADDLTGIATSATDGVVGRGDLERRPLLRAGEIVESVPGVIATQHSGGGKANQYFLRGFNLDHGTDLRISVEGMLVNLPSHGHGQGYADLSFLIPELIDTVSFRKGGYDTAIGDFGAAGSTDIRLIRSLPRKHIQVGGGENGYGRFLAAGSFKVAEGDLLTAVEVSRYDGPWVRPDDFDKLNAHVSYATGDAQQGWTFTAMAYDGSWDSTDQIPRRAVNATIDRFGLIDPGPSGESSRYSLSARHHATGTGWSRHGAAWAMAYDLDLISNFTYCLDRGSTMGCSSDDDQFLQRDDRFVAGGHIDQAWLGEWGDRPIRWSVGGDLLYNDIDNGLYRTEARVIRPDPDGQIRADSIEQWQAGVFADIEVDWTRRLRTIVGARADYVNVDVASSLAANTGSRNDTILSPKANLIFAAAPKLELYANYGRAFHSNDARGMTTKVDPVTLLPVTPADPLVRAETADIGLRATGIDGLQSTLTVFQVELDSELVFTGDTGNTEAGPASRRVGVEWANFYRVQPWLSIELDLTFADAEFTGVASGEDSIPGALERTLSAGLMLGRETGLFGTLRWRYFGDFPLIEDDSVRGGSSSLVNGRLGYAFASGVQVVVDVFNVLDRDDADIQYYYASRLPAEFSPTGVDEPVGGVEDVHFHPMESRSVRVWLEYSF